jgi:hypothetical protein
MLADSLKPNAHLAHLHFPTAQNQRFKNAKEPNFPYTTKNNKS